MRIDFQTTKRERKQRRREWRRKGTHFRVHPRLQVLDTEVSRVTSFNQNNNPEREVGTIFILFVDKVIVVHI